MLDTSKSYNELPETNELLQEIKKNEQELKESKEKEKEFRITVSHSSQLNKDLNLKIKEASDLLQNLKNIFSGISNVSKDLNLQINETLHVKSNYKNQSIVKDSELYKQETFYHYLDDLISSSAIKIQELGNYKSKLETDFNVMESSKDQYKNKLNRLLQEFLQLEQPTEESQLQMSKLKKAIESISELDKKISSARAILLTLKLSYEQLVAKQMAAEKKLNEKNLEKTQLLSARHGLKQDIDQVDAQNKQLKQEIKNLKQGAEHYKAQNEKLVNKIEQDQLKIIKYQKEIELLRKKREELSLRLTQNSEKKEKAEGNLGVVNKKTPKKLKGKRIASAGMWQHRNNDKDETTSNGQSSSPEHLPSKIPQ